MVERPTPPLARSLSNNVAGKLHTLRRQNLIVPSFALSCLPLFLLPVCADEANRPLRPCPVCPDLSIQTGPLREYGLEKPCCSSGSKQLLRSRVCLRDIAWRVTHNPIARSWCYLTRARCESPLYLSVRPGRVSLHADLLLEQRRGFRRRRRRIPQ